MSKVQVKDATQAHMEIERLAKENARPEVRFIEKMEVGQIVRQGDIYIHAIKASHLHGKEVKSRQLALGNTQGSRHMAEKPSDVYVGTTLPEWCDRRTFLGPLVKSKKRFVITHPEHAHVSLPSGNYQITHQMDVRTMDRVKD
jgi:hypothetical protein